MNNTGRTTEATCYCCKATDQPMVYTKAHGWKCRSAKACMARWSASRKGANEMTATTALGQREEEARRIARAEGFPIVYAEADWTFFTLGDDQTVNETEGQFPNIKIVGTKVIRTHFSWEAGRFEGFVS